MRTFACSDVWAAALAAIRSFAAEGKWPVDPVIAALVDDLGREATPDTPTPGPLADARAAFGLTPGEARALALVAAVEIDARLGGLFARVQGPSEALRPTVGTLREIADIDHMAFLPSASLRRHGLIELEGEVPLVFQRVRCPAAVWQRLVGEPPPPAADALDPSSLVLTVAVETTISETASWLTSTIGECGLVVVTGRKGSGRDGVAHAVLARCGWPWIHVAAETLDERRCAELEREMRWTGRVPVVRCDEMRPSAEAMDWLARSRCPRIWIQSGVPGWVTECDVRARVIEVPPLDLDRRREIWRRNLGSDSDATQVADVASTHRYGPARIARVVELAKADARGICVDSIVAASRATRRPGFAVLAEQLASRPREDLVVAPLVSRDLEIATRWAASYTRMYRTWGIDSSVTRARGVSILLAGPPGTGKTLAAQILAGEVGRDIFRVDLSQAVSKWLGETEKNLGRLFDEAEETDSVLFFDEADALFARRTQVSNANDRYANLETGYLLQRLEQHEGIVVLATNRRQDLDSAFLRRFESIIEFTLPGPTERERIWRRHLPDSVFSDDVDLAALAHLFELSGGQIRTAVIAIVAMAIDGAAPMRIAMSDLVCAATRELVRAGRLVNASDFGAWAPTVRTALERGQPASTT